MKAIVAKLIAWIVRCEKIIAFTTLVVILGALAADVIGRELFQQGVFGSVRVAVYALITCAMAGFGIATATGGHLRPKFLDRSVPEALLPVALRLGQFASAAILLALAWAGVQFLQLGMLMQERDISLDVLIWPFQLALPIGFAFSALRHIVYGIWLDLMPDEQGVAE